MKRCLLLVEGPFDELRVSLLKCLFDRKKLEIIPFKCDKLKSRNYYKNYEHEMINLLSIDKTFTIDDFDEIAQLCDTDGCFIPTTSFYEDTSIPHIIYEATSIKTSDLHSVLTETNNKITNINNLLIEHNLGLYYCATNIDHAFDGIQNPANKKKKQLALQMRKAYDNKPSKIIQLLCQANKSGTIDYIDSWDYIKIGYNSLSAASNLLIFVLAHYDELCSEAQIELINTFGINKINECVNKLAFLKAFKNRIKTNTEE